MVEKQKGKDYQYQFRPLGYLVLETRGEVVPGKGGVIQFTKALAIEWAKYNINVNSIAPYSLETEKTSTMLEDEKVKKR